MNAIESSYGFGTVIHGCFFHLQQCIQRKVQSLGLQKSYRSDPDIKIQVKMIAALAFVPTHCVFDYYNRLEGYIKKELLPLLQYFGRNYIGIVENNKQVAPKFNIPIWNNFNILEYSQDQVPRTNNMMEGWHNGFHRAVGCDHPTFWRLLEAIRKEQQYQEKNLENIASGNGKA